MKTSILPLLAGMLLMAATGFGQQAKTPATMFSPLPPVGSAIAYFDDKAPPPGWALCDGKEINAANGFRQDQVATGWWGRKVPDLSGKFLRGTTGDPAVGTLVGSDTLPGHSTRDVEAHSHSLPAATGAITLGLAGFTNPGQFSVINPFGGDRGGLDWIQTKGPDSGQAASTTGQGQHRHYLGGATAAAGGHSHTVDPIPFTPSSVVAKFIIRIY